MFESRVETILLPQLSGEMRGPDGHWGAGAGWARGLVDARSQKARCQSFLGGFAQECIILM